MTTPGAIDAVDRGLQALSQVASARSITDAANFSRQLHA